MRDIKYKSVQRNYMGLCDAYTISCKENDMDDKYVKDRQILRDRKVMIDNVERTVHGIEMTDIGWDEGHYPDIITLLVDKASGIQFFPDRKTNNIEIVDSINNQSVILTPEDQHYLVNAVTKRDLKPQRNFPKDSGEEAKM